MHKDIDQARGSIFKRSEKIDGVPVKGYEFNHGFDLSKFIAAYHTTGFQGTHLGKAIDILKRMHADRKATGSGFTLFLGYTSNQVTSGNREIIRYLVEHKLVDAIVTTAGGVEEDLIKCLQPFILGDFRANGAVLRDKGVNRSGNIFVPNDRYIAFEHFVRPVLDELVAASKSIVTPSELIALLGSRIDNTESILYWAAKHSIPVFSPALTDGSFGDITFFHQYTKQNLHIDILGDNIRLNKLAMDAEKTGALIIGAGLVKHQICNANMMREGLDYAIYLNTSSEFDGSDSGAEPEEAKSWGKISKDANTVKVVCDATIALPILIAGTLVK